MFFFNRLLLLFDVVISKKGGGFEKYELQVSDGKSKTKQTRKERKKNILISNDTIGLDTVLPRCHFLSRKAMLLVFSGFLV